MTPEIEPYNCPKKWHTERSGRVNKYLTQLLYGHGYFCKYLFEMGKMTRPNCIYDDASIDDAKHTFFQYKRWRLEKRLSRTATM